ncbi:hypothetical protein C2845_PM14G10370 [Panicum miliaceum]|uniref:RRM domain-containing protein n=1 Tax=Panicum miliaceum TaxID=4540 RepID=A0A3L6PMS2_PANMI|nr:hypothetical protein C2845_PM14G10370 [Panicum miliaceum]
MEARSTSQTSGGLAEAIFLFRRATHPSPVRLLLADGDSACVRRLPLASGGDGGCLSKPPGRPPFVGSSIPHPALWFAVSFVKMSQTKEVRYTARSITPPADRNGTSRSPPPKRRSPSRSPPPKSTSRSEDDRNPGNNLYVTGLSTRVTEDDLEKFFNKEGKVKNCHVVLDPRTKESRGFAFVTMDTVEDARRCIKYLHRTVLEGRLVTVEKCGEWGKPHVWLLIWGLNSSRADFMTFQFITWCWAASTSTWLIQAVLSSTMVVANGCAADVVVLITNPRAHLHRLSSTPSSPTLHIHYINARAATIERPWSLVVHYATITASTIATATASATTTTTAIVNVARMIQQVPWFVYVD